ncbi:hypothetical protein FB45DRAFT_549993 [Roridomyces roridus]|uniref:Uncharacterized protein n=1 Tax=Roridomyces roridus TaxID=1738132 RepID=A0AAD7BUL6_9AGAR|nr:hypothetical protein FB45DRAFT_549993 [Roridomyces roridus]
MDTNGLFVLTRRLVLPHPGPGHSKGSVQPFPWTKNSAHKIRNDKWRAWRADARWSRMIDEFADAIVFAQGGKVFLLDGDNSHGFDAGEPDDTPKIARPNLGWAFRTSFPFDPLVIFSHNSRVFVLDARKKLRIVGTICHHGGHITSIAVHPGAPHIFATTSADFTTRIYNLDQSADGHENSTWKSWQGPSRASAAHGTDGPDSGSSGHGRCIGILGGGRSGGHVWDVSCASFHPWLPLIVTCGVDRFVKIWRTPIDSPTGPVIPDEKPLFSACITTSQVLSIAWVAQNVLIMHTGTTYGQDADYQTESQKHGSIDLFQWLGMERYFPNGEADYNPVLRGGSSDYQESKTYTVLAREKLDIDPMASESLEAISSISQQQDSLDMAGFDGRFLFAPIDSSQFIIVNTPELARHTRHENSFPDSYKITAQGVDHRDDDSREKVVACAVRLSDYVALGSRGTVWYLELKQK